MEHSPGFLELVNEAREHVSELSVEQARVLLASGENVILVDVREDREWDKQHAADAVHLGKGILERDIEAKFPDKSTELIMYCGGGFRSALTADVARRMGYANVHSLVGGYKAMVESGWPMGTSDGAA
ncbi:MAG: rhodanese-like domain-containing protein [Verrucomicrobia bacterium]|jgi:rhodanese-related sulfurtransferase|nr:rhodanese-like domain-containing protein [Verrucomicrobiota bacterium]